MGRRRIAESSRPARRAQCTRLFPATGSGCYIETTHPMSSALRASFSSLVRRWTSLREERAETAAARRFWSSETARDAEDHYWGAQPLVRRAINRRVTGDPNRWPMEWFAEAYANRPFSRGLSIGCGS